MKLQITSPLRTLPPLPVRAVPVIPCDATPVMVSPPLDSIGKKAPRGHR